MKKIKRIFLIFISVCIFGITIYSDYQTVKAVDIPTAFWGTLEASRAFWTALNAGGGVRGGGVSTATFEHSSREDMHNLQVQVMLAYTAFCIWKEKAALKIAHPDWSDDAINQQAEVDGRLASDRFQNSAVNVSDTTKNLTIKDYGYWREFCDSMHNIAINGLGNSTIENNTPVANRIYNYSNWNVSASLQDNLGGNTIVYNGLNYVTKGIVDGFSFDLNSNVPTDRVRIGFNIINRGLAADGSNRNLLYFALVQLDINRLSGKVITYSTGTNGYMGSINDNNVIDNCIRNTNITTVIDEYRQNMQNIIDNYEDYLPVSAGGNVEQYEQDIKNALDSTEAGKAIKEGAKDGQEEIIKSGAIPVKRSSVRTGEETATGEVGWDVPDARTLEGAIAVPDSQDDVVEGMGIITVPEDVVTPKDDDTVAEWAKDEPISIPDTKDEPISKPIDDVISDQYGDYYPTQISLGDFFPFCIPFDIYYCVQKFNVGQGEAPIIHIPIVYPRALQGALGESYDVIIDFNNYIALRNIIRAFILIFFLIGLMQVTRNLIRG